MRLRTLRFRSVLRLGLARALHVLQARGHHRLRHDVPVDRAQRCRSTSHGAEQEILLGRTPGLRARACQLLVVVATGEIDAARQRLGDGHPVVREVRHGLQGEELLLLFQCPGPFVDARIGNALEMLATLLASSLRCSNSDIIQRIGDFLPALEHAAIQDAQQMLRFLRRPQVPGLFRRD